MRRLLLAVASILIGFQSLAATLPLGPGSIFPIGASIVGSALTSCDALSCVTIPTGLVFWMPFDVSTTGGNTSSDLSGNANNGTFTGTPSLTTGQIQQGISLNGTTQLVNLGNSATLNPTAFAISCWIKPTAFNTGTDGNEWIMARDDNALGRSFAFGVNPSGGLEFQVNGSAVLTPVATVALNVFSHVVVTGAPAGWTTYINGAFDATATSGTPSLTTGNTTIGERTYSGFTGNFPGVIDDCRMYLSLSAAQVTRIYNAGLLGLP